VAIKDLPGIYYGRPEISPISIFQLLRPNRTHGHQERLQWMWHENTGTYCGNNQLMFCEFRRTLIQPPILRISTILTKRHGGSHTRWWKECNIRPQSIWLSTWARLLTSPTFVWSSWVRGPRVSWFTRRLVTPMIGFHGNITGKLENVVPAPITQFFTIFNNFWHTKY
jgi:hypothetical protein